MGLVCCYGSGYEGVDLAAAAERGIAVAHSPGANAAAVADLAMGLMIASIRRIVAGHEYVLRGDWAAKDRRSLPIVRGLTGRRVGIYGLGAIGERIARRVAGFEMELAYHNRKPRTDVDYPWFATLRELAQWADVLMIAVRAGADNRHAVDDEILAALGSDGHVVNIARGAVIDEAALIGALRDGVIAGAGLDVFEHEPVVPPELSALANVVLTPHHGGGSHEAQASMHDMVCANVEAFLAGRPPPTPVPGSQAATAAGRGRVRPSAMRLTVDDTEIYAYTGARALNAALPTIMFVHGAAHDHSVWALQSRYFAHHGRNVLAVDLPGHGRSAGVPLDVDREHGRVAAAGARRRRSETGGAGRPLDGRAGGAGLRGGLPGARREDRAARPRSADGCERCAARRREGR